MRRTTAAWALRLALAATALGLVYVALDASGILARLREPEGLRALLQGLGVAGPALVVGAMALAVVVSPVPSAPIALAAGAAYGHTFGTLYVLVGAELGALVAFGIARLGGYGLVRGLLDERLAARLEGSQRELAWTVFATRLLPFVSFDAVSYLAGLTPLRLWRFALATLAGIAPASFVLAHFGGELAGAGAGAGRWLVVGLGLAVLLPPLAALVLRVAGRS